LEHSVLNRGIVEYECAGEWAYGVRGGWTPKECAKKNPLEWDKKKYECKEMIWWDPSILDPARMNKMSYYKLLLVNTA
jgi:hypothetical protein